MQLFKARNFFAIAALFSAQILWATSEPEYQFIEAPTIGSDIDQPIQFEPTICSNKTEVLTRVNCLRKDQSMSKRCQIVPSRHETGDRIDKPCESPMKQVASCGDFIVCRKKSTRSPASIKEKPTVTKNQKRTTKKKKKTKKSKSSTI